MPLRRISVFGCMLTLAWVSATWGDCADQVAKVTAADGQEYEEFGGAVALHGDTAIVGAQFADGLAPLAGAAYLFTRIQGEWTPGPKLIASDGALLDEFGISVAVSGGLAIVGATSADGIQPAAGAAYLFERIEGAWIQTAKLIAPDGETFDAFGSSVALGDGRAYVGSLYADGAQPASGSVYVFENADGVWLKSARIFALDGDAGDEFGISLAAHDGGVLAGAWLDDEFGRDAGAAYLFENAQGEWTQRAKLTASNAAASDRFGYAVALHDARAVIGSYLHAGLEPAAGSAYVFEPSGGVWDQVAELTAFDADEFDRFGGAVAVSGDRILVGANADDDSAEDSGSAYVFDLIEGVWILVAKPVADDPGPGHLFGTSLALEGDTVLIGSIFDFQMGEAAGSAYVYDVAESLVLLRQPSGLRVLLHGAALLEVAVSGHGPQAYQWQRGNTDLVDGGPVSGVNSPVLSIDPVTKDDTGRYRVIVSNPFCSVTSDRVTLSVVGQPGDLDVDGDLDFDDVGVFLTCLSGAGGGVAEGCGEADFDDDDDVDLADYTGIQFAFSPPRLPGDLDGDGDVDLDDFDLFAGCLTGPDGGILPGCEAADLDLDGDVDLADFAQFAGLLTPPSQPPADFDADGDVDLDDFGILADCLTGPDGGILFLCEFADLNLDEDVDLPDFALFQEQFTN